MVERFLLNLLLFIYFLLLCDCIPTLSNKQRDAIVKVDVKKFSRPNMLVLCQNSKSLSFHESWEKIANFIRKKNSHFAIVRYGDGELSLMEGKPIESKQDKWKYRGGKFLSIDLKRSVTQQFNRNYFYGLPFYKSIFRTILNKVEQNISYIVSANIFCNANYPKTRKLLYEIIEKESKNIILICNEEVKHFNVSFTKELITFPSDSIQKWDEMRNSTLIRLINLSRSNQDTLFFVSVGPISNILIWYMYNENPNNRYVDFGSSLDEIVKGKNRRPYANNDSYFSKLVDPSFIIDNQSQIHWLDP